MSKPATKMRAGAPAIIGWREWVELPDIGLPPIKAKIDTGARTSALHAFRIRSYERDEKNFVEFYVHPNQRRRRPEIRCVAPLFDERAVTSSNGQREIRYVIRTRLQIGTAVWPIELTLANREQLGFRMLIGRQAIRRHFVVDPSRSYLGKKQQSKPGVSTQ